MWALAAQSICMHMVILSESFTVLNGENRQLGADEPVEVQENHHQSV